jgi:hypothetical protein
MRSTPWSGPCDRACNHLVVSIALPLLSVDARHEVEPFEAQETERRGEEVPLLLAYVGVERVEKVQRRVSPIGGMSSMCSMRCSRS